MTVFPTEDREEAAKILSRSDDFGIIYITEKLAAEIPDEIEKYRFSYKPAIIPIPGVKGNTGAGMAEVNKSIVKAVGSDII